MGFCPVFEKCCLDFQSFYVTCLSCSQVCRQRIQATLYAKLDLLAVSHNYLWMKKRYNHHVEQSSEENKGFNGVGISISLSIGILLIRLRNTLFLG